MDDGETKLLPCPFCGEPLIKTGVQFVMWAHPVRSLDEARCPGVGVHILPTDAEAIAAWNRRVPPAEPLDRLLIEGMIDKHGRG